MQEEEEEDDDLRTTKISLSSVLKRDDQGHYRLRRLVNETTLLRLSQVLVCVISNVCDRINL